jgi:aminomethyltransferase
MAEHGCPRAVARLVRRPSWSAIVSTPSSGPIKRTPFYSFHQAAGARLIDFGGWELPVQYEGILAEHKRVREQVGLFDVSHMGEIRVRGPRALEAVRYLVCNDLRISQGQAQYSPMCNEDGGIVDDLIVYKYSDDHVFICVNAANRDKDFAWMVAHNPFPDAATFTDEGDQWAQVALQGRFAAATLQKLTAIDLSHIKNYWFADGAVAGVEGCIVARTGYTGEDGFEIFLPVSGASTIWPALLEAGAEHGLAPIGLGARDTLRLEAKMCLYGNDIDDTTTPLEANLAWTVKLEGHDFIGKGPILAQRQAGVPRRLVCLEVDGRIGRHGNNVVHDGAVVGVVTSGTKAPTVNANIAIAYVPAALAAVGTRVEVDVRGKLADAVVVKGPFYKRNY